MAFLPSGCHTVIGDDGNDAGTGSADAAGNPEIPDQSFNSDAFWAQDPPPMYCGLDGGMLPPPPPPGGTPQCPDDKNRQGCPCNTPGDSAACWPGLRKNRGLGICKDGTTSCIQTEVGAQWGQCVGYVLPDPGATSGADACECFSAGTWALNNLVPCFYTIDGSLAGASSSLMMGGMPTCPSMSMTPLTLPSGTWSIDTITVDCIGHWKLCYTLKAGDASNPQPTDCVMASTCTEGNYTMVNMSQPLPDLPAWVTTTSDQVACAEQFTKTGGYGEMSVDGTTVTCEQVQKVFNRVNYCPLSCNTNPMDPACMGCGNGGSGTF
jgi:hypothetical protein